MNLTVGPLPPAVYWRRRAIIIGALLLVVVFFVTMCSGSGNSSKPRNASSGRSAGTQTPGPGSTMLNPIIGSPGDGGDGGGGDTTTTDPASPSPGDTSVQVAGGDQPVSTGPCADADILLTAVATPLAKGFYLSMKVKNTSTRACSRDVGGGPQELEVVDSTGAVAWSSDSCAVAGHSPAPDVRTFGPGIETVLPPRPFYWDGTLGKCSKGSAPGPGSYRLVARLGTKASQPLTLIGK